jgi:hypothetical protein
VKRVLLAIGAIVTFLGVVVASASALSVEGGGLMALTPLFESPGQAGTSIGAQTTATGFWVSTAPQEVVAGVRGEICVANEGEVATEGLRIVDVIQTHDGGGQYVDYVTEEVDVSLWPLLPPGQSYCYSYEIHFAPVDGAQYRNVAHVTITNHSGWLPGGQNCPGPAVCPFGPDPKADFTLPAPGMPLEPLPEMPAPEPTAESTATEMPTPASTDVPPPQPPL